MLRFIDAFKLNEAPYFLEDLPYGGERKVYCAEAYTGAYMIRSDKTGRLCRYLVDLGGQMISAYQHYGIKPTSDQRSNLRKLLTKMKQDERYEFIRSSFDVRFKSEKECDMYFIEFAGKRVKWQFGSLEEVLICEWYGAIYAALVIKN